MKTPLRSPAAGAAFLLFFLAMRAFALDADEIVRKADGARGLDAAYSFLVKVKNTGRDGMQEAHYKVYIKGYESCLVDTVYPERQQGRKLLMLGNDLWFYTPSIKRPTRVSLQQKLTGEVANGDIAKTNFAHDYDASVLGEEVLNGKKYYHLDLRAKRKDATYRRIEYWVEFGTFYPYQVKFYAITGKLLKTGIYGDVRPILGRPRMGRLTIRDA